MPRDHARRQRTPVASHHRFRREARGAMTALPQRAATDLAAEIRDAHHRIEAHVRAGLAEALHAGDLLLQAKAQIPHGSWLTWLRESCGVPERTAQLYMRLARHRGQLENRSVADLSLRGAVALLARPVPEPDALAATVEAVLDELDQRVDRASTGAECRLIAEQAHKLQGAVGAYTLRVARAIETVRGDAR